MDLKFLRPVSPRYLFILKLTTFLQPLQVLSLDNVIIVTMISILEEGFTKNVNIRNLRCFTN